MCGIVCAFELKKDSDILRPKLLEMSKKVRHRGPDWSGIYADNRAILAHERLAIVDPTSGKQPIFNASKTKVLAANGEIYNHSRLKSETPDYQFTTQSDCEVVLAMYEKEGVDFINKLNGIFGF
jgi:asparagine synthase (glutamine-hydrolysing)